MAYERIPIPLVHLRLNKENDRHGPLPSEPNCIHWMLENLGKEILNLAKDIAERGLSPIDGVLVLPNPESTSEYVVWEGNRRITALIRGEYSVGDSANMTLVGAAAATDHPQRW